MNPSTLSFPSYRSRLLGAISAGLVRFGAFLGRGFRPHPVGRVEAFLVRALFAYFVIREASGLIPHGLAHVGEATAPNGIAQWIDLSFVRVEGVMAGLRQWAFWGFLLYVAGVALPLVLPYLAFCVIVPHTLTNSQGFVSHSTQIVGLILLVQAVVVWMFLIKGVARRLRGRRLKGDGRRDAAAVRAHLHYVSICAVVTVYVTAALTKHAHSKGEWLRNSPYLSTQIVKVQRQSYYKRLDPKYGEGSLVWAHRIAEHPNLFRLIFGAGFFLELLAFVALYGRKCALVFGVALIGLHIGIEVMMGLRFRHHSEMLLVFLVNPGFWLVVWPWQKWPWQKWGTRWRGPGGTG